MSALANLLRWLHYGQASMSVALCDAAVDRAKHDLALALAARDRACAEIVIHDATPTVQPTIPAFLRRQS